MLDTSNESGTMQVYLRAFPDNGSKWQISSEGGTYPNWSSDKRTILFCTNNNQIMTAGYTAKGTTLTVEKPPLWAEQRLASTLSPSTSWRMRSQASKTESQAQAILAAMKKNGVEPAAMNTL